MRIETLDQRQQREQALKTKRDVLAMATRHRDQAEQAIARLTREIAALELEAA